MVLIIFYENQEFISKIMLSIKFYAMSRLKYENESLLCPIWTGTTE